MLGISYWVFPLFAAATWFATLMAMLLAWIFPDNSPRLSSMEPGQNIAYISDIGAGHLQPLFIAGSTVCVVVFDAAFIAERWLRHKGRLAHNTSWVQKTLSLLATIFAVIGAAGLILLTIFDTVNHPKVHATMLAVFIVGYIISAIFICAEYQRLGIHYREHRVLRNSFWIKLAFIFVEIGLAIAFAVLGRDAKQRNKAAILEWVVSLIYIIYILSFVMDFLPAVHSKHNRFPSIEMGMNDVNGPSNTGGPVYAETGSNASYGSNRPMQETNRPRYTLGGADLPPSGEGNVQPSRNF